MPKNVTELPNNADPLVWGAAKIGAALNMPARQCFYQLESGRVPGAQKWGRRWAVPGSILRKLAAGELAPLSE